MLKDYEFDDDDYKPDELQNDVLLIDFYDGAQLFQLKTCESLQHVKRELEIEVIEMICLYEGLFPDDQNSLQLHQIMDLVSSIKDVWPFDRLPYSDLARNSSIPLHGSMLYAWGELLKNTRRSIPGRRQQETNAEKSKEDASWLVWNDDD